MLNPCDQRHPKGSIHLPGTVKHSSFRPCPVILVVIPCFEISFDLALQGGILSMDIHYSALLLGMSGRTAPCVPRAALARLRRKLNLQSGLFDFKKQARLFCVLFAEFSVARLKAIDFPLARRKIMQVDKQ